DYYCSTWDRSLSTLF
nr:immunoglobulin light chain junction region [Macaca mulatta]MOW15084.1 immunoglobulin light chain junction region [Macaca mulatta]MOW15204.1 immunoglobulin light chain junction region [Macaca mulatta]MOW15256.1 immunoglobulin light chain junction region [Macaca mulatta]MOW15776.1 immunoglobulin light chain junction region [Macaca mulatta]